MTREDLSFLAIAIVGCILWLALAKGIAALFGMELWWGVGWLLVVGAVYVVWWCNRK